MAGQLDNSTRQLDRMAGVEVVGSSLLAGDKITHAFAWYQAYHDRAQLICQRMLGLTLVPRCLRLSIRL